MVCEAPAQNIQGKNYFAGSVGLYVLELVGAYTLYDRGSGIHFPRVLFDPKACRQKKKQRAKLGAESKLDTPNFTQPRQIRPNFSHLEILYAKYQIAISLVEDQRNLAVLHVLLVRILLCFKGRPRHIRKISIH